MRVLVVGEDRGLQAFGPEALLQGESGRLLRKLLTESNIASQELSFISFMPFLPPGSDLSLYLYPTKLKEFQLNGTSPRPILIERLTKLYERVAEFKPDLIIACGNWAFWALSDKPQCKTDRGVKPPVGIGSWRGSQLRTSRGPLAGIPLLPIYSPGMILRDYTSYYPTLNDLKMRGNTFLTGGSWDAPVVQNRHAKPNFAMTKAVLGLWLSKLEEAPLFLAADIETYKRRFISVMGFADGERSICIPFFSFTNGKLVDYFTLDEEVVIFKLIRAILLHPNIRLIGQNFSYDHTFIRRVWGIKTKLFADTMLMHHLCWPGTPKALDYLSSLYCAHHVYWKDESNDWDGKSNPIEYWTYNCQDTEKTFEIFQALSALIKQLNLSEQWNHRLEMWQLSMDMSAKGVRFDESERQRARVKLLEIGSEIESFLLRCMPADLRFTASGKPWFASPTFTATIFYDYLKIQPVLNRKTKRPTTDASSFDTIKARCPILTKPLEYLGLLRSIGVFSSNFLSVDTSYDKRIRCTFNTAGTSTFRWSSNVNPFGEGTNLQNIPEGNEDD